MRDTLAYVETWKSKDCPLDREPCSAEKCALFEIFTRDLKNEPKSGWCELPNLSEEMFDAIREATGRKTTG